jgi:hypothetical protein
MNVCKCKLITFSRLWHPVEFSYMLAGIILDRVDFITDLGVGGWNILAMLGSVKKLSLVHLQIVYGGFLRRAQKSSLDMLCKDTGWTDMYTIFLRMNFGSLWVADILSGRVSSTILLYLVNEIASRFYTRGGYFLRIDFHSTITTVFTNPWIMLFGTLIRLLVCLIFICQEVNFLIISLLNNTVHFSMISSSWHEQHSYAFYPFYILIRFNFVFLLFVSSRLKIVN